MLAWSYVVQRNRVIDMIGDKFISLSDNKEYDLFNVIEDYNPDYIMIEEFPETFMDVEVCKKIYSDKNRQYVIVETTHNSGFTINEKIFLPDKFIFVCNDNAIISNVKAAAKYAINVYWAVVNFSRALCPTVTYKAAKIAPSKAKISPMTAREFMDVSIPVNKIAPKSAIKIPNQTWLGKLSPFILAKSAAHAGWVATIAVEAATVVNLKLGIQTAKCIPSNRPAIKLVWNDFLLI